MSNEGQQRSVLLIGVQDAGKSNFLFRFWLSLDAGKGVLRKAGLPADMDYLKTGAEHLLKGEFAGRTSHDVMDRTEIPVKAGSDGQEFSGKVVVPDIPGEQVLSVFRTRQWASHWEDEVKSGCGCLLFVRIDSPELVSPIDWVNCPAYFGGQMPAVAMKRDDDGNLKPSTQVVLVEWLQFLRKAFTSKAGGSCRPRIGIVVAAWDLVPHDQKDLGPAAWIKSNLPMLSQFIASNDDNFDFAYFGISVASGDFESDPGFKESYLQGDPRKAGEVVYDLTGTVQSSTDATLPVAWALGIPVDVDPGLPKA